MKKQKRKSIIILLIEILILIALLIYFGKTKLKQVVVEKTTDKVIESVITEQVKQMGASEEEINEVLDKVSDDDKQAVEDIITNHLDSETINKGTEYIKSGDIDGLKDYASQTLTPEETEELMNLYEKYKDVIN